MTRQRYHIAAAARLTGLSPDIIRKWEGRYGLIRPQRDAGGMRTYTSGEIARLRLARLATERGHPIRKVAALSDEAIAELLDDAPAEAAAPPATAGAVVAAALAALRTDDPDRLRRTIFSAVLLIEPRDLVLRVFVPLLREIGTLWDEDALAIWQEHMLSEVVGAATGILTRLGPPRTVPRSFVFATPPGEAHAFGIAFAAMLTAASGFGAHNLGADVPVAELVDAAARLHVGCVVVGITALDDAAAADYVRTLDAELPRDVELWVGGAAGAGPAQAVDGPRIRSVGSLAAFGDALDELA